MDFKFFLREAYFYAEKCSMDKSTHCGALLFDPKIPEVVMAGANLFTSRDMANDPVNHERPRKYQITEHAERLAIYEAAKKGIATRGLILFAPWAACTDCARAIIHAGIFLVVAHKQAYDKTPKRWREEVDLGIQMFNDCGVIYHLYDGKIDNCTNLFNGEIWYP